MIFIIDTNSVLSDAAQRIYNNHWKKHNANGSLKLLFYVYSELSAISCTKYPTHIDFDGKAFHVTIKQYYGKYITYGMGTNYIKIQRTFKRNVDNIPQKIMFSYQSPFDIAFNINSTIIDLKGLMIHNKSQIPTIKKQKTDMMA